jgi:hypothetical protein
MVRPARPGETGHAAVCGERESMLPMRCVVAMLFLSLLVGPAFAADDPRRAQVAAATADALKSLREEVLSAPVTANLTIAQFIEETDARDELATALRRAEQIGGTRWLDEQTCQVRLELRGAEVANALVEIAEARRREAGLPADVLRDRIAGLREVTFAATGMSTNASERLRPAPDQTEWRGIPKDVIRAAVADARRSAAEQVLESVEGIDPVASAFGDPKVRDALQGWLMNRPVTAVEFGDDLEVRVEVAVTGEDFWDELGSAAGAGALPQDEAERRALRAEVLRRIEPAVGRAYAKGDRDARPEHAGGGVEIPREPPTWVARHVDARGTARPIDGRLKTARAAERAARANLARQIEELTLTGKLSIGEAARRDDHVRDAVERTVRRAQVRKVNYLSDGSAEVSFSLDLRELWRELEARR